MPGNAVAARCTLVFCLSLGVLLMRASTARAIMCASSAQVWRTPTLIYDSDSQPLGPSSICVSDAAFQGEEGGQVIDGVAHAAGAPGTTGPAGFKSPSATAEADLTATTSLVVTAMSTAASQYWYEFMICPISSGCPSSPPPIPINIPVLMHYSWDLQAAASAGGTAAPVAIEHRIGFSNGSDIIQSILTQRIGVTHLTLPSITPASVTGNCSESIMAIVGSSCADARSQFFSKTGVLLPIQAGQLYTIKLFANAQANTGSGGGTGHARAFIDPVIEIDPAFANEYEVVYADGAVVADSDGDGLADSMDNCPFYASPDQNDADADGRGDECECTDQNGDGVNNVLDLIAINLAIFNPALATPLCDGNNDGQCNVADIVAANVEIFSPTSTSTCGRQPLPGP